MSFGPTVLQSKATAQGNGTIITPGGQAQNVTVYVRGTGTINTGTVLIETSDDPGFTGTWTLRATIDLTALSGVLGGMTETVCIGPIGALRARVSVALTGGGVCDASALGV